MHTLGNCKTHPDLLQVWVIDTGIRFRNIKHVVSFRCQTRNGWAWVGWRRWEGTWCFSHSESCSNVDFSKDTYIQSLHHPDKDEKENYFFIVVNVCSITDHTICSTLWINRVYKSRNYLEPVQLYSSVFVKGIYLFSGDITIHTFC